MNALRLHRPDEEPVEPKPRNVGFVCAQWLKYHAGKWSNATWLIRRASVRNFCGAFGRRDPDALTPLDMDEWIRQNPAWQSDWTIKRNMDTIRIVFKWAAKSDLTSRNPFKDCTHPTGENGRDMTGDEFRALVRGTDAPFRRVLFFMRLCGARPCEMSRLGPEHVTWPEKPEGYAVATLRKHKTSRTRRDKKPRELFLCPVLVRLLRWLMRGIKTGERFFLNMRGGPWTKNALDLRVYRLRKRLGLAPDLRLYATRHSYATNFLLDGGDVATLQQLMGHTNPNTTARYIHLANQKAHFEKALNKSGPTLGRRDGK